jgi:hypothetical protein
VSDRDAFRANREAAKAKLHEKRLANAQERAAAETLRIEAAIAQKLTCRCGHSIDHHDAGECWTAADGSETHGETSCPCSGYDPVETS